MQFTKIIKCLQGKYIRTSPIQHFLQKNCTVDGYSQVDYNNSNLPFYLIFRLEFHVQFTKVFISPSDIK